MRVISEKWALKQNRIFIVMLGDALPEMVLCNHWSGEDSSTLSNSFYAKSISEPMPASPGVPYQSPIQVLFWPNVAYLKHWKGNWGIKYARPIGLKIWRLENWISQGSVFRFLSVCVQLNPANVEHLLKTLSQVVSSDFGNSHKGDLRIISLMCKWARCTLNPFDDKDLLIMIGNIIGTYLSHAVCINLNGFKTGDAPTDLKTRWMFLLAAWQTSTTSKPMFSPSRSQSVQMISHWADRISRSRVF